MMVKQQELLLSIQTIRDSLVTPICNRIRYISKVVYYNARVIGFVLPSLLRCFFYYFVALALAIYPHFLIIVLL